ncbi:MAG: hypothetical protein WCR58_09040 [Bacteroidales bacterium]|jgi:hypothetical protein|nr:hypothetical protein [Bacteroidales bacterium]MCK9449814.1 hypothetical protein [Bacteroidales bacterium]MDD3701426.1 hypothetical protein [Bacteroidales bacterium]MDY0369499.1 hypothetical protein [Bacteroidales bacterium]
MHYIEPHYTWRQFYTAERDTHSPFYGRKYSLTHCSHAIYNYLIHPQWDEFGSQTLYGKLLYCHYEKKFCVIELMGEWNDVLHNDIMFLYRGVIEWLLEKDIRHFIIIGENILNFHSDGDDYYAEWFDNIDDGWIICLNFRPHVIADFIQAHLDFYLAFGGKFDDFNWRAFHPEQLYDTLDTIIQKRLNP